ncbi:hypothetical protein Kpho02_72860 [Kitasatospora phosalacinea]|uniref:Uncharacterized protein n=1 Tax=Kitasatospora phosalacinea TaxID=2065 RepID=A0A9W6V412_9ACTN|nr:hypothetical protein [Kitasatospora phosalacinea]GLW74989.1 hypothetical protein Kpho02_72860 [Kitasatospora phosalacinea]
MVDGFTKWVNSLTAAAPKSAEMRELMRRHDRWLAGAQLGRTYYAPDAYYQWQEGTGASPVLGCYHSVVFDDRGRDRLYTPSGSDSIALWLDWGGLDGAEPSVPGRPTQPYITGRLQDWDHPELWTIKQVTR